MKWVCRSVNWFVLSIIWIFSIWQAGPHDITNYIIGGIITVLTLLVAEFTIKAWERLEKNQ